MRRFSSHAKEVKNLRARLLEKHKYFTVAEEVPLYADPNLARKVGQADVLTVDLRNRRLIYWEVKTGRHAPAYAKAKKQAQAFYSAVKSNQGYHLWQPMFVYYNPKAGVVRRIHQKDV